MELLGLHPLVQAGLCGLAERDRELSEEAANLPGVGGQVPQPVLGTLPPAGEGGIAHVADGRRDSDLAGLDQAPAEGGTEALRSRLKARQGDLLALEAEHGLPDPGLKLALEPGQVGPDLDERGAD